MMTDSLRVHAILLDTRYDYDSQTGDRIGAEQLIWLDRALSLDADMTIIGSGIQVMADRYFFYIESMRW